MKYRFVISIGAVNAGHLLLHSPIACEGSWIGLASCIVLFCRHNTISGKKGCSFIQRQCILLCFGWCGQNEILSLGSVFVRKRCLGYPRGLQFLQNLGNSVFVSDPMLLYVISVCTHPFYCLGTLSYLDRKEMLFTQVAHIVFTFTMLSLLCYVFLMTTKYDLNRYDPFQVLGHPYAQYS